MTRTLPLAALAALLATAPAAGAANLLDTLTVDPGSSSFAVGTTTLHPGTRYSMDVSGVFQETGPEGYGFKYDGLYCYDGVGFAPDVAAQQCPHSGSNDKSHRSTQIAVGVGSTLAEADQFGSPGSGGKDKAHEVAYDPNHSYAFAFYAPTTGKLKAGGPFAVTPCPSCRTTFAGGPIVIKLYGPATSTGGGGGGGGGGSSTVKTVTPLTVSEGGPVTCVTATRALAFAAASGPCPFGQVAVKAAPPSGTPVDTSSPQLKPNTKSVTGFIHVDQAAVDNEAGWVVDKLDSDTGDKKFRDLFEGCLLFGGVEPEADFLSIKDDRERLVYFVCAQVAAANLRHEHPARRAHAASSACRAVWVPIWKAHSHPTRREYRAAVAAHNRMQKTRCTFGGSGKMTFSVVARHRTLNRALGRQAKTAFARIGSAPDGQGARMTYTWGTT